MYVDPRQLGTVEEADKEACTGGRTYHEWYIARPSVGQGVEGGLYCRQCGIMTLDGSGFTANWKHHKKKVNGTIPR